MPIEKAYFVADLHGRKSRCDKLCEFIYEDTPELVLIGGDILPSGISILSDERISGDFLEDYLKVKLTKLRDKLGKSFPTILVIEGNDDPKIFEKKYIEFEEIGLWKYINQRIYKYREYDIAGYAYVPPTPFLLKDWEKYDVSRFVDVGCVSPEEGFRSEKKEQHIIRHETIAEDLEKLAEGINFKRSIFLFHSPPYNTKLDRINTSGKMVDHVQPDDHVGSIAIHRFIQRNQPLLTLHGHIHESTSITGEWHDTIGRTYCINASTNKSELSVVRFSIIDDTIKAECLLI